MRTSDRLLLALALSTALPTLGLAQEIGAADPGPALDPAVLSRDTAVTLDSTAALAEPGSLEGWSYDDLYASGISINEIMGADVYDPEGEDIGDVENVLFDMDGRVLSVIAEIGGFLEFGDTHVNIPWEMISAEEWEDGVVIPFTEDEVEGHIMSEAEIVSLGDVSEVQQVSGDGPGTVDTGVQVWAAGDFLGDTARLREGEAFGNFGVVNDLVVRDGMIAAVLVSPDGGFGTNEGLYGYPYAGQAGWTRGMGAEGTYDLPYDRAQAEMIQPFDPAMLAD